MADKDVTENEIVAMLFERDQRALEIIAEQYGALMCRCAMRVLNDSRDAEECVNDAYRALWDAIPPQKPESLANYAAGIAKNLAYAKLREKTAQKRGGGATDAELSEMIPGGDPVDESVEIWEIRRVLTDFLTGLSKRDRMIFVSRYVRDQPVREISDCLGISESAVKSALLRARKKLSRRLAKEKIWL